MTTFSISQARYIAAASICQAVKDSRYYLLGVCFSTSKTGAGVRIAATDGHRLLSIEDREAEAGAVVFSDVIITFTKEQLAAFKKKGGQDMPVSISTNDDGTARVAHNGVTSAAVVVDGKFPDIDRVIPELERKGAGVRAIGVNPRYIGDFATVARLLADVKEPHIALHFGDVRDAIRVQFGELDHVTGVVMPTRL